MDTIGILFRLFAVQAKCEVVYPNGEAALADVKLTMSMNEVKAPVFFWQMRPFALIFIEVHPLAYLCPFIQL